ncbi:MAG: transposase [Verrucomicrobiales bacterium]
MSSTARGRSPTLRSPRLYPNLLREGCRSHARCAEEGGALAACPSKAALSAEGFLHRFLQHVLPRGFMRVRHFGFLSAAARKTYQRLRALLRAAAVRLVLPDTPPHCCAACGGNAMQFLFVLRPNHSRAPPTCLA